MTGTEITFEREVASGQRFAFGRNWKRYLSHLTAERLSVAETSLIANLGDLNGKSFLDIGCGSGLFSVAASRLGARVRAFDYDPDSVSCTRELMRRWNEKFEVEIGSVLDQGFLERLGQFDIVYSWGVLHHTGRMWDAINNACTRVKPGGILWIAIYNDQGKFTRWWRFVKRRYNASLPGRVMVLAFGMPWFISRPLAGDLFHARNPFARYFYHRRGMAVFTDIVDWLGGWPFEVAKPEEIFDFCTRRDFVLRRLRTCGGTAGCNEFVFSRVASDCESLR